MSEEDKITVARLEEKVDAIIESDKSYRSSLCAKMNKVESKLDQIFDKFSNLPCRERSTITVYLWGALTVIAIIVGVHLGIWK